MSNLNQLHCEDLNRINLHLFFYGRDVLGDEWRGVVYNPPYSRLLYATDGEAVIKQLDGDDIVMKKGNWYLIPAGCSFEYWCDDIIKHFYFRFKLCDFNGIDLLHHCDGIKVLEHQEDLSFWDENLEKGDIFGGLSIRTVIYDRLLKIIKENNINIQANKLSPYVEKAVQYISQNLSVQLTADKIAKQLYISKTTLNNCFKRELSMSIHAYINNLVLSEAMMLLMDTNMSVFAISKKFGFCDQFYFTRIFTKKFGVSPLQYRKSNEI
ncbi:MAG: helix-turn-helix domain-containing protein [Clostridia bacterium]|nr:helix-turn-helix domain-containing protein [Clostridia bacterium]